MLHTACKTENDPDTTDKRHTFNKSTQVTKFHTSLKFGLENMQSYLFLRFMFS